MEPRTIPDLDEAPYSEGLRRQLYDAVARILLSPERRDAALIYPDIEDLAVFYAWGRWFAVWHDLSDDTSELPPSRVWQVVRLSSDPRAPEGLVLHEV